MILPLHKVTNALYESSPVSRTAIVFIHGNSADSSIWQQQFGAELLQDYAMAAFDLPGHGKSLRLETYSLTAAVDALVEQCINFQKIVLVGHSLGGHLAIEALPQLPNCCGLFIFGTPPIKKPINLQEAFLPDERIALLFKAQLNTADRESFARGVCDETAPLFQKLHKTIVNTDPKFREGMGLSVANGEFSDEVEILRNAHIPVAIIHGLQDALVNSEYIEGLEIPFLWQQRVEYIENSTHSPHIENPSRFNRLLLQFLEDLIT